jgi:c-di-GMP-binding flagellar brake protein YcgR
MNKLRENEQRKFARLKAYHLAKYRLVTEDKKELVFASIKDISGGGACLKTGVDIPKGSFLQIYFNFPYLSSPIPCLAKVVWGKRVGKANHYELGLEFLEIEDVLRQGIVQRIDDVRRRTEKK